MELKRLIANQPKPFVIAGPCSAESREQMIATAKEIAEKAAVSVLRAGIWKPRTRPDSFEGDQVTIIVPEDSPDATWAAVEAAL